VLKLHKRQACSGKIPAKAICSSSHQNVGAFFGMIGARTGIPLIAPLPFGREIIGGEKRWSTRRFKKTFEAGPVYTFSPWEFRLMDFHDGCVMTIFHPPQFSADVSKMQPILFSQSIQIRCLPRMHLVWQCSGMDEQVMLIVRVIFCPGLLIAFSEQNEIAIRQDDLNLTKYFANEGGKA
jgi:hypothetical protein